ncbi:cupin domain-containing protein [Dyadobacter sp. CY326]|uniref:cupin domain-containing protein n=1 Tax=Dyadobacter sp. CY326 TaxID=2907300 RepID=UPI001F28EB11|nr:cupin domain-containing protein [Dyadobacter sp. CY326]MCE7068065.1 cupin domain-containing protein [Dyadobacter sp. CY326]
MQALQRSDLHQISEAATGHYTNLPLGLVNDHVIRISIMTEPFYWHYHPNSDESFLCIEGILVIDLEDKSIELHPGQLFTIPKNVLHKTRPKEGRSVNLTFELEGIETVRQEIKNES